MSDKLFEETPQNDGISDDQPYIDQLVGEGKKYKDQEALAKALVHKDRHISTIETENKTYRDELKSRATVEDFMTELKKSREVTPDPSKTATNLPEKTDQKQTISETDIEAIFERKQAEEKRKANLDEVKKMLSEKWGSNFASELKSRAAELGVSEQEATELARNNPKAFYRLIGVDSKTESLFSQPQTRVNVDGRAQVGNKKNFKYYEDLRRKDYNAWTKVQSEIMRAAQEQGESFYN